MSVKRVVLCTSAYLYLSVDGLGKNHAAEARGVTKRITGVRLPLASWTDWHVRYIEMTGGVGALFHIAAYYLV